MAKKLKDLEVTKVDFVDEGANPKSYIKIFKRKDSPEPETNLPLSNEAMEESIMKKIANALAGVFKGIKVEKSDATSFNEKMSEVSTEKIRDEIWTVCYALQSSLGSIVSDEELDSAGMLEMMNESINQFHESMQQYASIWAGGDAACIQKNFEAPDDTELPMIVKAHDNLGELIEKSKKKGEPEEMIKIDKSKMSPEERASYDDIIKKYAVDTEEGQVEKKSGGAAEEDDIDDGTEKKKEGCNKSKSAPASPQPAEPDDVYKGLHPAVKAELEALKKFREDAESRELYDIAKKYEIIGKKPEELVPTLKSLKAAGGTALADMLGVLDSMVPVMQKGVFGEIGKSREGNADNGGDELITKARAKAAEIKKLRPELTDAQALDEALLESPELMSAFDK